MVSLICAGKLVTELGGFSVLNFKYSTLIISDTPTKFFLQKKTDRKSNEQSEGKLGGYTHCFIEQCSAISFSVSITLDLLAGGWPTAPIE
jgi:hypothetical protein